jgi:hypothetical protein
VVPNLYFAKWNETFLFVVGSGDDVLQARPRVLKIRITMYIYCRYVYINILWNENFLFTVGSGDEAPAGTPPMY